MDYAQKIVELNSPQLSVLSLSDIYPFFSFFVHNNFFQQWFPLGCITLLGVRAVVVHSPAECFKLFTFSLHQQLLSSVVWVNDGQICEDRYGLGTTTFQED